MTTSLDHVRVKVRRLLNDLRQILAGARALLGHLVTRDPVEVALGTLSAESTIAVPGRPSRYVVTVASAGSVPRDLTLTLDIYLADSPSHPDGHYAYFSKHMTARPRGSTRVEVHYDWRAKVDFLVENTPFPADGLWKGNLDRPARYSVSALLYDPRGNRLDFVTVYQDLRP